ncbi:MAG: MBL fold metallo-hydrolase [Amphritea sp.]
MKKLLLVLVGTFAIVASALAQDVKREIVQVSGDVYRFQNNFHFSLVVATSEGTVVVDPINNEASSWLKENLSTVTDKPVTHLIYSHSHGDHASGGATFADDAEVIAHANAPDSIDGVAPEVRFEDTHTLSLGGKTIELTYLGPGHGQDMIAVVVRPENVAFIVDVAAPKRLPYRDFGGANIDGFIAQVKKAETLEFEIFAPGHGRIGTPEELTEARIYVEDLRAGVLAALKAGKTVEQITEELSLEAYSDWQQYKDWRPLNIQGMVKYLTEAGLVE